MEDLQEKYQEFKKVNCEIYAISTDTHFAHKTWHDISENISKIDNEENYKNLLSAIDDLKIVN